jgi:predicted peroxiredoxin
MDKQKEGDLARKQYKKTLNRKLNKKVGTLTVIVTEDTYDKALTAFNISVAAIEMGMYVSMFFTSRGINILKTSYKPRRARWGEAPIGWKETYIRKRGGPVLAQLMYQAKDMGVHLYVCYTSMISTGLNEKMFITGVKTIRMAEFLQKVIESDSQIVI